MNMTSRRSFIKYGLAASTLLAAPSVLVKAANANVAKATNYTETKLLLGTYVSITVAHQSQNFAQEAIAKAFAEVERLQGIFNRHDGSTPLSVLNTQGVLKDAPAELVSLLHDANSTHATTSGAFNVAITPLLALLKEGRPSKNALTEAHKLVDISSIKTNGSNITLQKSGMSLTFDGIAKGAIVDKAVATLLKQGALNHLVNAGGDIYASGLKADGRAWNVAIESPAKDGNYPHISALSGRAMATSGSYENFFDAKRTRHHLIMPEALQSTPTLVVNPSFYQSVSVQAPTAKMADALATALFVLPPAQAMQKVNSLTGCAAFFINGDGTVSKSNHWL